MQSNIQNRFETVRIPGHYPIPTHPGALGVRKQPTAHPGEVLRVTPPRVGLRTPKPIPHPKTPVFWAAFSVAAVALVMTYPLIYKALWSNTNDLTEGLIAFALWMAPAAVLSALVIRGRLPQADASTLAGENLLVAIGLAVAAAIVAAVLSLPFVGAGVFVVLFFLVFLLPIVAVPAGVVFLMIGGMVGLLIKKQPARR